MAEVLFELTKEHMKKNLRNVPLGFSRTSYVDPERGVFYAGRPILSLITEDPLAVVYLLLKGEDPSEKELKEFTLRIAEKEVPKGVLSSIFQLPRQLDPLVLFALAINFLSPYAKSDEEDFFLLLKVLPLFAACAICHHQGKGKPVLEEKEDYLKNFLKMIEKEDFFSVIKLIFILYLDHGGGLESFVGKSAASSQVSLFGSLSAAMLAYGGELTGKASLNAFQGMEAFLKEHKEWNEESLKAYLLKILQDKKKIFGFGHPDLRVEDPRATILYNYCRRDYPADPYVRLALAMRTLVPQLLKEKIEAYANADAIVGPLLSAHGWTEFSYMPLLSAFARSLGVAIQIYLGDKKPLFHPLFFYEPIN